MGRGEVGWGTAWHTLEGSSTKRRWPLGAHLLLSPCHISFPAALLSVKGRRVGP